MAEDPTTKPVSARELELSADLAERLLAIGRDCAARFGPEYRAIDHDAALYDAKGLPRGLVLSFEIERGLIFSPLRGSIYSGRA
jgi:hypothetical protein